jgi:glucose/arabinose dehydrogenase
MDMKLNRYLILAMLILFTLSGCGTAPAATAINTPTQPVLPTLTLEAPTATVVVSAGTAEPAKTIVAVPAATSPAGTLAPLTFPPSGGLIVGLEGQGRTVVMHVGDRFLLQLGEVFDWTVTSSDDTVVGRVPNVMVIRGAQGLYEGRKEGEATLTAIGDPLCRTSTPACAVPSISFTLQVQVEP